MALTPSIRSVQSRALAAADDGGAPIEAQEARALAVVSFPTEFIEGQQAAVQTALDPARPIQAQQARILAVCRGRVASPYVTAWTFTLDGHDFYVLALQEETYVYDFYSDAWSCWASGEFRYWLAEIGVDWNADLGGILLPIGGTGISNVLVGDQLGGLFFLAPERALDDVTGREPATFQRVLYGQLPSRGRESVPCYGVEVYSSAGFVQGDATVLTVELETSDDQSVTFDSHGTLDAPSGAYDLRLEWLSLGSIVAPGRLFRLTDYGALTRIDAFEMVDEE